MLAMLGIPPTIGFIGRWRLYETAVQIGWPLAAVFILSSILALIAYVLALTRIWWGPPAEADSPSALSRAERSHSCCRPPSLLLVVLILAAGIWPDLLDMLHWGTTMNLWND